VIPVACWRCETPGEIASECRRPPPATRKELQARIDRYIERWISGEISIAQKREWIKAENKMMEKVNAK
jgi:hypothetical protein